MGHIATRNAYKRLRERLDRFPVGAPGETTIYEILKLLYTPEEAELGAQLPLRLSTLGSLSRKLGRSQDELKTRLDAMAAKGIVLDLHIGGKTRYMLTPTIVGFFEFSMMRVRDDLDQPKLAELYHRYMIDEPDFAGQFNPDTKISPFRTMVHEDVIPEDYTEVLDWERATHVVKEAGRWGVGVCHCRHVAHHLGHDCEKFHMESSCLTIGPGADYIIRQGFAREIEEAEAQALLVEAREAGMVHLCDNVQRRPSFLCNCCGCCCEVLLAFKKFELFGSAFSSNFVATVNTAKCIGCKKCMKACPVDAIDILEEPHVVGKKTFKRLARVEAEICLGCGVCARECKSEAMKMAGRSQRRIVPESTFARILGMSLEQGKLHELLIDKDDGLTAFAANTLLGAILKLPPAKQLLARDALRSRFVDFLIAQMSK